MTSIISTRSIAILGLAAVLSVTLAGAAALDHAHVTGKFSGVKANAGTATHTKEGKANVLTLSKDFVIPDTPAPHWQVVDSKGNVHLLQRLKIKGDKVNTSIKVPGYVADIAKVQIWCSWAETLLGEASFPAPVK